LNYLTLPIKKTDIKQNTLTHVDQQNICNKNISSSIYKYHKESHPSKIFEWLYIGGYSNAMNKEVRR